MSSFEASLEFARALDRGDPLRSFRDQFWLPRTASGEPQIYLLGNSLGLQPKRTADYVQQELEKWQRLAAKAHFESDQPWMPYHEFLARPMAQLVGAHADEVVMMNSLTVNLHLMLATFYRPTAQRHQILIEEHAFPSDHYAVVSQLEHHRRSAQDSLLLACPPEGEQLLCSDAICQQIERHADSLAVVLLPGVQYYTGQVIDLPRITRVAQQCGAIVGLDLAHAAGNTLLELNDWNIDFAVWCSYKYLNSGPGSVAGCFIHRRHAQNTQLPRLAGWWGHDKATRFLMENRFQPIPTAEGWQVSNPPILSLAAIRASLDVFDEAGGMKTLREKSVRLTAYFQQLLEHELGERIQVVTPDNPDHRGCQLSLQVQLGGVRGKEIQQRLEAAGTVTDWREPNVIRAVPVPLYNSFEDVHRFVQVLQETLNCV